MEAQNPWAADSLEDYLHYCCRECDMTSHSKDIFLHHALQNHPMSNSVLSTFMDVSEYVGDGQTHEVMIKQEDPLGIDYDESDCYQDDSSLPVSCDFCGVELFSDQVANHMCDNEQIQSSSASSCRKQKGTSELDDHVEVMIKCRACKKKLMEKSLLRHLVHKSDCQSAYSPEEFQQMKEDGKARANKKHKQRNRAKILDQGRDYYYKNREAIRSKQRAQHARQKVQRTQYKHVLRALFSKIEVVNKDISKTDISADPHLLQEAISELKWCGPGQQVPVDAKFLDKETDDFLGDYDEDGTPVLDISDIDLSASVNPDLLQQVIGKIQRHIELGNRSLPATFMRRQIATHKRDIIDFVHSPEEELLGVLEKYAGLS